MKQRKAIEVTGCTARQLDYWVRSGYIEPDIKGERSGRWHDFDDVALIAAYALRSLVEPMINPEFVQKALTQHPHAQYLIYVRWDERQEDIVCSAQAPQVRQTVLDTAQYVIVLSLLPIRNQLENT